MVQAAEEAGLSLFERTEAVLDCAVGEQAESKQTRGSCSQPSHDSESC